MLWIISGPTSAGKSTFIKSRRCSELTGLPAETPVVWPAIDARLDELGSADAFYHYNILRPLAQNHRRLRRAMGNDDDVATTAVDDFDQEEHWSALVKRELPKRAVVLVSSKETILQRVRERGIIEEAELRGQEEKSYPTQRWLRFLEQVDLAALYRAWCRELREKDIPYLLLRSDVDTYPLIEDEDALSSIVDGGGSAYSRDQIAQLLRERRFGYHRVELPYGLHTRGEDRSATRDLVLPPSLEGKSVLDVGSALGYFSFAAEARGAARVVGVDLREERLRDALLLKDIKGSKVEFILRDIVLDPLDEVFDYVLLLNVVHHLAEPVRAIRQLASITRERLIIEFPTLEDPKFRASVGAELPPRLDELPLVGVSSMRRGVDQTFVFTPSAIERILLDHERLFERVEILGSPIPGRAIAIAHRGAAATTDGGAGSLAGLDPAARKAGRKEMRREQRRRERQRDA